MPDITITLLEGEKFGAYCALPAAGQGPGLVVIQEIFGVNAKMRQLCDDFAAQGYIAVCPDLFWRQQTGVQLDDQVPEDMKRAMELLAGFDVEAGVRDLLSTLGTIRQMNRCAGKVGAVGYCLGGKLAYLMATRSDVDATVSYYGVELDKYLDEVHDIRLPLLLHIGAEDPYVPPATREKILRRVARNPAITAEVYEGVSHAFARVGGQNYNQEAANLANLRTTEFLAENLQS
jgi:carboxymethylenebutenolidase